MDDDSSPPPELESPHPPQQTGSSDDDASVSSGAASAEDDSPHEAPQDSSSDSDSPPEIDDEDNNYSPSPDVLSGHMSESEDAPEPEPRAEDSPALAPLPATSPSTSDGERVRGAARVDDELDGSTPNVEDVNDEKEEDPADHDDDPDDVDDPGQREEEEADAPDSPSVNDAPSESGSDLADELVSESEADAKQVDRVLPEERAADPHPVEKTEHKLQPMDDTGSDLHDSHLAEVDYISTDEDAPQRLYPVLAPKLDSKKSKPEPEVKPKPGKDKGPERKVSTPPPVPPAAHKPTRVGGTDATLQVDDAADDDDIDEQVGDVATLRRAAQAAGPSSLGQNAQLISEFMAHSVPAKNRTEKPHKKEADNAPRKKKSATMPSRPSQMTGYENQGVAAVPSRADRAQRDAGGQVTSLVVVDGSHVELGSVVVVKKKLVGRVAYLGVVQSEGKSGKGKKESMMVGVELFDAKGGNCDGTFGGSRLFVTGAKQGVVVGATDVKAYKPLATFIAEYVLCGWLSLKQTKDWKRRWCLLNDYFLYSFANPFSKKEVARIALVPGGLQRVEEPRPHSLSLALEEGAPATVFLSAPDQRAADEWMKHLQAAAEFAKARAAAGEAQFQVLSALAGQGKLKGKVAKPSQQLKSKVDEED